MVLEHTSICQARSSHNLIDNNQVKCTVIVDGPQHLPTRSCSNDRPCHMRSAFYEHVSYQWENIHYTAPLRSAMEDIWTHSLPFQQSKKSNRTLHTFDPLRSETGKANLSSSSISTLSRSPRMTMLRFKPRVLLASVSCLTKGTVFGVHPAKRNCKIYNVNPVY